MMRPYALQDLITLPPILAAVLSRHGVCFAVQIDGSGARAWRFEFERRAVLRVEPGRSLGLADGQVEALQSRPAHP